MTTELLWFLMGAAFIAGVTFVRAVTGLARGRDHVVAMHLEAIEKAERAYSAMAKVPAGTLYPAAALLLTFMLAVEAVLAVPLALYRLAGDCFKESAGGVRE